MSADSVDKQTEFAARTPWAFRCCSTRRGPYGRASGSSAASPLVPTKRPPFVIDTDRRVLPIVKSEFRMSVHADHALEALRARATEKG